MDVTGARQNEAHRSEKWVGGEKHTPFLSWNRPHSYWDVVGVHFPLAIVTGIPLLLSNWVPCNLLPLKPCTFLQLTGYPCPFCGFTRSFWAIAQGDWAFAVHNYPLACFVYILTVLVFAWNTTGLLLGVKITRGRFLRLTPCQFRWAIIIVTILFILNWAYRISLGLK